MRKLVLVLAAAAAVGFTLPVISAQAEEGKVVIKTGERGGHHRHWNRGNKKVFIIKNRGHEGWRRHHARGSKVILRHD
jgi:hypothetical protein